MRGSLAPQAIRRHTRHNPALGIVGQGSDAAVSLAALIAAQRAEYGIPVAVSCRALGVSQAWFHKWRKGDRSPRRKRRAALAATIAYLFARHNGHLRVAADHRGPARAGLAGVEEFNVPGSMRTSFVARVSQFDQCGSCELWGVCDVIGVSP